MICWSAWSSSATRMRIAISLSPVVAKHQLQGKHRARFDRPPSERLQFRGHRAGTHHRVAPVIECEDLREHLRADAASIAANAIDDERELPTPAHRQAAR